MSIEENKAVALRYFTEAWGKGDIVVEDAVISPDFVDHNPTPGFPPNKEGTHQFLLHFRQAFPDLQFTLEDLVAEGDRVVDRWTMYGTHLGEFLGTPPSGKKVVFTGIDILRIVGGQIVESWHIEDQLGAFQQIGMIPKA